MSTVASARHTVSAPEAGRLRRIRAWAEAADLGETPWGERRPRAWELAGLVASMTLLAGAYLGREHLADDILTWFLLTAANLLALSLALLALSRSPAPPVLFAGILTVFVVGGLLQLCLLSYNLDDGTLILTQIPALRFISSADIAEVYGLVTLGFVTFCLAVAVLGTAPFRRPPGRSAKVMGTGTFATALGLATVLYLLLTLLQLALGFGRNALQNPVVPFKLIPITLFYRLQIYPALLLLGVWVFDRTNRKLSYLCVVGTGVVALCDAYISTHRGALVNFGLPVLFIWLIAGRFTKFRKSLVAGGLALFLVISPVLSAIRVERVVTATGSTLPAAPRPPLLSVESLNVEVGRFLLRVGGAVAMLLAIDHQESLEVGGLARIYRPYGMTEYFTYEVNKVPVSSVVAQGRSPTLIGMGTMIGGAPGIILVVLLTTVGLSIASRAIVRYLWAWPVALSILTHGAIVFFSEGVTILFYKSILAIVVAEVAYRVLVSLPGKSKMPAPVARVATAAATR